MEETAAGIISLVMEEAIIKGQIPAGERNYNLKIEINVKVMKKEKLERRRKEKYGTMVGKCI